VSKCDINTMFKCEIWNNGNAQSCRNNVNAFDWLAAWVVKALSGHLDSTLFEGVTLGGHGEMHDSNHL
jgi:hypothetical protein